MAADSENSPNAYQDTAENSAVIPAADSLKFNENFRNILAGEQNGLDALCVFLRPGTGDEELSISFIRWRRSRVRLGLDLKHPSIAGAAVIVAATRATTSKDFLNRDIILHAFISRYHITGSLPGERNIYSRTMYQQFNSIMVRYMVFYGGILIFFNKKNWF